MEVSVNIGGYRADLAHPLDISVPVKFDGAQVTAFGGAHAHKDTYQAGSFVGDVRQGGSCNCETYHFSPHLNGTHTECVGHLTRARISVSDVLKESLIPATVVTVRPGADCVITIGMLEKMYDRNFFGALIVRTLPNAPEKLARNYDQVPAPYFDELAMHYIVQLGVRHLLVDFPSVDKMDDGGKLANHRIFWDVAPGSTSVVVPSQKTITELVYVPDSIVDGPYLLNLQVAAFAGDAAPSRPVLYRVMK